MRLIILIFSTRLATMSHRISKEYIASLLPSNPIVVEAGAHKGRDTLAMSKLWPRGSIHAFEPLPDIFTLLQEQVGSRPNVTCYEFALSDIIGLVPLYKATECTPASSLLEPQECLDIHESFEIITVPTITLDEWARRYDIPHVDFLWLDLQGPELQVLQAAPKILKKVQVIHTEVNLTERYKANPLYPEVRSWLYDQGFIVHQEAINSQGWGDVLFVREF